MDMMECRFCHKLVRRRIVFHVDGKEGIYLWVIFMKSFRFVYRYRWVIWFADRRGRTMHRWWMMHRLRWMMFGLWWLRRRSVSEGVEESV